MIAQEKGLKKAIGVWGLTANIINIMIGAGIFALPALVAGVMGSGSIFSYLFCGILIMLVILCFAEAGSKVNNTGGSYTYIETAFGDYAGFIAGIFALGANMLASAVVAML
ncbi:MAG TPA: amino acid permease [Flavobacteriaceae bacterium]|nr:amino acid permease [Flavobacteriaceae bacterium]